MRSISKKIGWLLWGASFLIMVGCGRDSAPESQSEPPPPAEPEICRPSGPDRSLQVAGHAVEFRLPEAAFRGNLLLLPGWNFSRTDWCENSSVCDKALARGYALILPEMGKSVYSSRHYTETRADWRKFPTGSWLRDTLIPHLQDSFCLLLPDHSNFMLGLSTGGRGVALTALHLPELFQGVAALSGDYDQRTLPGDNLMRGFYGTLTSFPDRWSGRDNPTARAAEFRTPVYLGHGRADKVVPVRQTLHFADSLRAANPALELILHLPDTAGHDYAYWDSEVDAVLEFFRSHEKN